MSPTVLLVDDEASITASLSRTLAFMREDFTVLTAERAQEGLEILRSTPVDVVVSDEQMPEMAGSEFLSRVREEFPDVVRIILTGQASMDATIAAINDARVFRFLTKPCPPEDFITCLDDALASRNADGDGPEVSAVDELDRDLSEALTGIHMVFQPILRAAGAQIFAYEALLRSSHPSLPGPEELLSAAAHLDRELEVDRRIRPLIAEKLPTAPDGVAVFVNLCPGSLYDEALLDGSDVLDPYSERIVLEMTEQAPLGEIDGVSDRLAALRDRGYRLALDDFGAGYNGLTSFATLQPHIVKFDKELVQEVGHSPTRRRIVSSLVNLCREMEITTLAEGIETAEDYRHLVETGCDLFQGWVIGKPTDGWGSATVPD